MFIDSHCLFLQLQDPDRVLSTDGVFTVKEEFNDDNQDTTIMANTHFVYKEHLHDPCEVGSVTGHMQRQPQPVVYMHMDGPGPKGEEATLPSSNLSSVRGTLQTLNEPQRTFELKNMLSKVLQKLESMDERLDSIEKRMKVLEERAKIDSNDRNSRNKKYSMNINKGAKKLKFNFSVDINDSNDVTNAREDSMSSECGVQSGDSSSHTPINHIFQDEHREHIQLNHNNDVESSLFHQASALSLANEQRRHIESLHDLGPLLSSYATKPRQRYRQPCKSFIKKALSYYYTRQELATCRFRETSLGSVRRPPLSPKRLSVILEEAERVYPEEYRKLNIAEVVNSKCRKSKYCPQKEAE